MKNNKITITKNYIFGYCNDGEPVIGTLIKLNDDTQFQIPNPINSNDHRIDIIKKIIKHLGCKADIAL